MCDSFTIYRSGTLVPGSGSVNGDIAFRNSTHSLHKIQTLIWLR